MTTMNRATHAKERPVFISGRAVFISGRDKIARSIEHYKTILRNDRKHDIEVPEGVSPSIFRHGIVKAMASAEVHREVSGARVKSMDEIFLPSVEEIFPRKFSN